MRNSIATQREIGPERDGSQTVAATKTTAAAAPQSTRRRPAQATGHQAVASDFLTARLPPQKSATANSAEENRGWGPASLLCLLAWLAGLVAVSALPGAAGWLAGLVVLLGVPAAWLGWQLNHLPPERGGHLPSA